MGMGLSSEKYLKPDSMGSEWPSGIKRKLFVTAPTTKKPGGFSQKRNSGPPPWFLPVSILVESILVRMLIGRELALPLLLLERCLGCINCLHWDLGLYTFNLLLEIFFVNKLKKTKLLEITFTKILPLEFSLAVGSRGSHNRTRTKLRSCEAIENHMN